MKSKRIAAERGHAEHGWLDSWHTFSFADYYDPEHMGFRALRVINDDRVEAGQGFGRHPHRDMEIVSYVLEGALAHRDSLGHGSVLRPGDVQRMSAGTGVTHSEMNGSKDEPVHFLQIWILPRARGLTPGYAERRFEDADKRGRLRLVVSADGRDESLPISADVSLFAGILADGERAEVALAPGRHAWVQVARGRAVVNGEPLEAGDGLAISAEPSVVVEGRELAEVLVFDLA